jgi:DNA-binding transcriptional regulator LsrR (DeoR family)
MKENHRMQQLFLIRRMTEDGKTQDQIAAALDVGKRRVQRILASGRKNP